MRRKTQKEIAQELGISKCYLSLILSGKRNASPEMIQKLQAVQGIHKVCNFSLLRCNSQARSRGFESHHPLQYSETGEHA